MKVALLCSGLGNVLRGHEVFARSLFELVRESVDITLFKGGGSAAPGEIVIDNIPRDASLLRDLQMPASPRWMASMYEQERLRIETETFAHAALKPLLQGGYDVIHCLEQEVCDRLYSFRHLFARTPKILFSNGGAIPAERLPRCDFVQEYTEHNLRHSARKKAILIPHGVDTARFHPNVSTSLRDSLGIPPDAFVVISVGTVCYSHKRMDYVIREVARVRDAYLLIVGEESADAPAIRALGKQLMGDRVIFCRLPHEQLPQAYAAANVFVLGSLFETFGIVYIEAMAMGLPVICSNHPNQRSIVRDGIFLDMTKPGALTSALNSLDPSQLEMLSRRGRQVACAIYDVQRLKAAYVAAYARIADFKVTLPRYTCASILRANLGNAAKACLQLGNRLFLR